MSLCSNIAHCSQKSRQISYAFQTRFCDLVRSAVFFGSGLCSAVRSAVPHSVSSFSELGQPDSSATERCPQRSHIVTLFEHRELLEEIEMIFVRFPDLAVLRFSDSAFSTSLTTSDVSRDMGFFFCRLRTHVSRQRRRTGFCRENNDLAASINHVQPYGSALFLHQCGGLAHQTSLRSHSIMMFYANSPSCGEAGGLFS